MGDVEDTAVTPDGDSTLAAQVLFDPASRRAIVVAQRFTLPADRDYELWAIEGANAPISMGVVPINAKAEVKIPASIGVGQSVQLVGFSSDAKFVPVIHDLVARLDIRTTYTSVYGEQFAACLK